MNTTNLIDVAEHKKTDERFLQVVEAASNAMIMVGADGLITLANTQSGRFFGYERQELLGMPLEMLLPERFRSSHGAHMNAFFAAPATRSVGQSPDLFGLRKDGGEVPVKIGLSPIVTADGLFVLASIIDITERVNTEERLQFFQALVDGAQDYGIFMLDPQGYILSWNAGARRMKGYSASEAVGKHFSLFYTPDAVSAGHPEYELRMARENGKYEEEGWRIRSDGSLFWAAILIASVLDKHGKLRGFSKLTRDITERKRSEERQRENEKEIRRLLIEAAAQKFHGALEAVHDAIVVVDSAGKIAHVNNQLETLFGYQRSELLGSEVEILIPHRFREDQTGHGAGFFSDPSAREVEEGPELFALRRDGSEFPAEIRLSPVHTLAGIVAVASIRDITKRKRASAELESKTAEMERFTYTVSHDLKSPLITIKSYVAMIDQDLGAGAIDRARSDLKRVAKAADKMNRLLEELLELSRVGRVAHTPERAAFGTLVEEALELAAGGLRDRNVHVDVAEGLPSVTVGRRRMVEVLQNLIDNASKFMGSQTDPRILIGASDEGPEIRFFVKDNGVGVDAKHHERIFGLFDKLDQKSAGSGAGLAIVKRIIEMHGGRIWVESPGVGGGSTFWFTLKDPDAGPLEVLPGNTEGKQ